MARWVKGLSSTAADHGRARLRSIAAMACTLCGFAPLAISLASIGIARVAECRLTEADVSPCMLMGTDIGSQLYDGAMMFWLFFLTAPVAFAALVLWGIAFVAALLHRTERGRSAQDAEEAASLRRAWKTDGRFVLQDDDHPWDHDAIDKWITRLIDRPSASPADEHIRSLVYHSLNFDIPFAATRHVRERLLEAVRKRPVDDGAIPSQAG